MFKKKSVPEHLKETVISEHFKKTKKCKEQIDEKLEKTVISHRKNDNFEHLIDTVGNPNVIFQERKEPEKKESIELSDLIELLHALREEVQYLRNQIDLINKKLDR